MSLIVDQTWVPAWRDGAATPEESELMRTWLRSIRAVWHPLVLRFPPLCIVRAIRDLSTLSPYSVALVSGYTSDGLIEVQQYPQAPVEEFSPDDLQVEGYWKGLSPEIVSQLLPKRIGWTSKVL